MASCPGVLPGCRSTFPGSGRFTGHWTGDNGANWQSFGDSIASILAPNMWGIPMVGADVCGFIDMDAYNGSGKDTDPPKLRLGNEDYQQLCNRWAGRAAAAPGGVAYSCGLHGVAASATNG